MNFIRLAQLHFLPRSLDAGLLVVRLWFGLSLLVLHGWVKFSGFAEMSAKFPDPLGVGSSTSLTMAVFGEVFCAVLVVLGLFTRIAAIALAVTMSVAFFIVHKGIFSGPGNGELGFVYLGAFIALFVAGPGRFSLDARLTPRA